ncbi:queuosine precursor transporter [Phycisphaerales bacterium AB-hyl4]|uniref:Probable queuosine precursor transporter n=1 Tax=Natronomicrosphaera hydrolytica TaxID=3242702 RepID=A0ABV4U863_9BACT
MADLTPSQLHERRERVFLVLAGLFLGTLAMLNILGVSRFIVFASWHEDTGWQWGEWGPAGSIALAVAVGVLPYPLTFLCTDLISEFYGRRRANFVVFVGLLVNLWVIFILWVAGVLPSVPTMDAETGLPATDDPDYPFYYIRMLTFGAVSASMIAYLAAQLVDVHVFHFWKRLTRGRWLWLRNNGSTMVSQFVDTFAVITITHFYARALPIDEGSAIWPQLWLFIATGYVFKVVIALVDTGPIYIAVHYLSKYLHIDPTQEHLADVEETRLD